MSYLTDIDKDLEDENQADNRRQMIAAIGQAVNAAMTARGNARVGKGVDSSPFQAISQSSSKSVSDVIAAKRKAQQDEATKLADEQKAKTKAVEEALTQKSKLAAEKEIEDQKNIRETAKDSAAAAQKAEELDLKKQELAQQKTIAANKLSAEATKPKKVDLSPQETSRQRTVGEEVGNYQTKGGRQAVEDSISKLEAISSRLESPKNSRMTGTFIDKAASVLGAENLRDTLSPDQLAMKQQVKDAVLPGLKAMFPGATSDTELKTFMELTWDDRLSPTENAAKIRARLPQLRSRMESLESLSGSPSPLSEDQQALDWANSNSSDPRAAAIKSRLGK